MKYYYNSFFYYIIFNIIMSGYIALPPNPNPPTTTFNNSEFSPYINQSTINYINNNSFPYSGGVINGSTSFLSTVILGSLTAAITTSTVPLNVVNYCNTNIPSMAAIGASYGAISYYINSLGVNASLTSSSSFNYSAMFSEDIACNTAVNFSDKRIKTNIIDLPDNIVNEFIDRINPKLYNLKTNLNNDEFGYISQELYKKGFSNLVQSVIDDKLEEEIDEDGFISPAKVKLTISYTKIIPILHAKIKMQDYEINKIKVILEKFYGLSHST